MTQQQQNPTPSLYKILRLLLTRADCTQQESEILVKAKSVAEVLAPNQNMVMTYLSLKTTEDRV